MWAETRIEGGLAEDARVSSSRELRLDLRTLPPGSYRIDYDLVVRYEGREPGGLVDDITVNGSTHFVAHGESVPLVAFQPTRGAGLQSGSMSFTGSTQPFALDATTPSELTALSASCEITTGGISTGTRCRMEVDLFTLALSAAAAGRD